MSAGRAADLEFRLLGPLEVVSGGRALPLGGAKQRALLALLLLHANEAVPRDRLIDGLWGDRPPDTAANALQVAIHGLRKVLGRDRVETHGTGYRIRVQPGELDLHGFHQLVEGAREERPARAPRRCEKRSRSGGARRSPTSAGRRSPTSSERG